MGILSRKHVKNRGERYDRRKAKQARRHTMWHGRLVAVETLLDRIAGDLRGPSLPARISGPRSPRWTMTAAEREQLALYNAHHNPRPLSEREIARAVEDVMMCLTFCG